MSIARGDTLSQAMDALDLHLVDEPVARVLAAWPHARLTAVGRGKPQLGRVLCGWHYAHDRLARLAGVTELDLARALEVIEAVGAIERETGTIAAAVREKMQAELAPRTKR
jgi:hypothetical protein